MTRLVAPTERDPRASHSNVFLWRDVFVVVDNGKVPASNYRTLKQRVVDQASGFEHGVGCLTIVPRSAMPPPEDVRRAIGDALGALAGNLRCLCWLIEGSAFQAAMVRGVLSGIRMLSRPPYPTLVTGDMDEALTWMLPYLGGGASRLAEVPLAREQIRRSRSSE